MKFSQSKNAGIRRKENIAAFRAEFGRKRKVVVEAFGSQDITTICQAIAITTMPYYLDSQKPSVRIEGIIKCFDGADKTGFRFTVER